MTRDEFIGKLRSIYVGEENAIDEIISEYDRLKGALQTHEILLKTNVEEIDRLNNIINEFESKGYDIATERAEFLLEIQRLNNIISELEKFMIDLQKLKGINQQGFSWGVCQECLDKLKALKEDNNGK